MKFFYKRNPYPLKLSPKIILVSPSRRLKLWLARFCAGFLAVLVGKVHSRVYLAGMLMGDNLEWGPILLSTVHLLCQRGEGLYKIKLLTSVHVEADAWILNYFSKVIQKNQWQS